KDRLSGALVSDDQDVAGAGCAAPSLSPVIVQHLHDLLAHAPDRNKIGEELLLLLSKSRLQADLAGSSQVIPTCHHKPGVKRHAAFSFLDPSLNLLLRRLFDDKLLCPSRLLSGLFLRLLLGPLLFSGQLVVRLLGNFFLFLRLFLFIEEIIVVIFIIYVIIIFVVVYQVVLLIAVLILKVG